MSNPRSERDQRERDLADQALHLSAHRPRGPTPTLLEIEQFRQGALHESRRAQVLSHLAQNPSAFALLKQLERADVELGAS